MTAGKLLLALCVGLATTFTCRAVLDQEAASPGANSASAAAVSPAAGALAVPGHRKVKLSFRDLGVYGSASLRGVEGQLYLPFGIRLDEVVVDARLRLHYTYSPSLLPELSHLRVAFNEQVVAALPLTKEQSGIAVHRELDLAPSYFTDFNQLRLDLIGHYTLQCEDPGHSSLWTAISDQSEIELTLESLQLKPDLALLPAPFFDRRDNRRLQLPVILSSSASVPTLRNAGLVASWFGALASYRGAHFPVLLDQLPEEGHALVLATNTQRPKGLELPEVEAPTLRVISHPRSPGSLLLVLQGRDDAQLQVVADALVLGQAVLSGSEATVLEVNRGERRVAYDAPAWVRTDRPVKLGELIDSPDALQARGKVPPPLRVNLRLPPDLLTWNRSGVPMDLRYRYTPPPLRDESMLTVSINDQLLKAFPLLPGERDVENGRLRIPLLSDGTRSDRSALVIPPFQLGANNQLQFQFVVESNREGTCKQAVRDLTRAAIDADSTIDLSGFPHYTAMPNLALFANAAYPFSRYADLAETAVVLPVGASVTEIEAMLDTLGRMGRATGVPSLRYTLLKGAETTQLKDLDLILVGAGHADDLLGQWGKELSVLLKKSGRSFTNLPAAAVFPRDPLGDKASPVVTSHVSLATAGPLAAMLGFESPLSKGRSVVALTATSSEQLGELVKALGDDAQIGRVRGDTVILRGQELSSFAGDTQYHVGTLSWWMKLWYHLSRYPLLMLLLAVGAGLLLAFGLYGYLRRAAEKRLGD